MDPRTEDDFVRKGPGLRYRTCMAKPPARLFHAVVVLGAALTSCDRRGGEAPSSTVADMDASTASPTVVVLPTANDTDQSGIDPAEATGERDAATGTADASPPDAVTQGVHPPKPSPAAPRPPAGGGKRRCPPGSERPFPPCAYIL
jgi:hypothetical protein